MPLTSRATQAVQPYVVPPSQRFDGNDGSWSTFKMNAGTPGQDFRVLPSTKGSVAYVIATEGCIAGLDPSNCQQLRGIEVFNSAQNIGFQTNRSSSWSYIGKYDVDLEANLGLFSQALFGFEKLSLGPAAASDQLSLDKQVVAAIADPMYYMGVLPLGIADSSFSSGGESVPSFLVQLRNQTKIPSLSYSYTAGAKYRSKSVFGSLILGGYDSTRFTPSNFSFTFSQDPSKFLTVGLQSIVAENTLLGTVSLTSEAIYSVIDSTVPHLWLPGDVCEQFEQAFGLSWDPNTDLYLVNDTIHATLLQKNPTITLRLANSLQSTTTNYTNIKLPYAAFDLQASSPFYNQSKNYFPIRRAANESQYVIGRTILQESYLIVDFERSNFTLAPAKFSDPMPAASVASIAPPGGSSANGSSSGLSTGAIVGIAVGAGCLVLLAILGLFLYRRKRRQQSPHRYELASGQKPDMVSSKDHATADDAVQKSYVNPPELSGTPLTELASPDHATHDIGAHKSYVHTSELSGTPMTELASPLGVPHGLNTHAVPRDQKGAVALNIEPVELSGESAPATTSQRQEAPRPAHISPHSSRNEDGEGNIQ